MIPENLRNSDNMEVAKESGLIKSTIVLAPDLVDFSRLLDNIRNLFPPVYRNVKLRRFREMAEKSHHAQEDSETIRKCFDGILEKMEYLFFHKVKDDFFQNSGEKQACMWLLCTMYCDNLHLPEQKNIFYTGIGFGEFWALTYRMYLTGKISFREAVQQAKLRGISMELLADPYYVVHVKDMKKERIIAFLPRQPKVGILATKGNQYYLYGTKEDLRRIAYHCSLSMQRSLPFFSQYMYVMSQQYSRRFPHGEEAIDPQVIYLSNVTSLKSLVEKQFYECVDEAAIRRELSCYEPCSIKEI